MLPNTSTLQLLAIIGNPSLTINVNHHFLCKLFAYQVRTRVILMSKEQCFEFSKFFYCDTKSHYFLSQFFCIHINDSTWLHRKSTLWVHFWSDKNKDMYRTLNQATINLRICLQFFSLKRYQIYTTCASGKVPFVLWVFV